MKHDWSKILTPTPNGWERLEARLEVEELKQQTEIRAWVGLSAAMISGLVMMASLEERRIPVVKPQERLMVENAQVIKREGMPPGINYYWVFQK